MLLAPHVQDFFKEFPQVLSLTVGVDTYYGPSSAQVIVELTPEIRQRVLFLLFADSDKSTSEKVFLIEDLYTKTSIDSDYAAMPSRFYMALDALDDLFFENEDYLMEFAPSPYNLEFKPNGAVNIY